MPNIFMRRGCGCIFAGEYKVWSCEDSTYQFTYCPEYFTDDSIHGVYSDQNEWKLMSSDEIDKVAEDLGKLIGDGANLATIRRLYGLTSEQED